MTRPPLNAPAGEQVTRLLTLVPYALTRREVPVAEAARDLGVSESQVIKDLKVLMFCGLPGLLPGDLVEVDLDALGIDYGAGEDAEPDPLGDEPEPAPDVPTIRVTNADYLARPLRLTVPEASALIVAMRTLRDSAPPEVVPVVERALAKVEAAAEDGADAAALVAVHLDVRTRDTAALRNQLEGAITAGRRVDLAYHVPARDERTTRVVDPIALLAVQGNTYLDAWCHRAEDRRLFRLDRIESAVVTDEPVDEHDLAPREVSSDPFTTLFEAGENTMPVVLHLDPPARWVAEYYPVSTTRELPGGRLEVTLPVADERWLQRLLGRVAPHARVVSPSRVSQEFTARAQVSLRLYEGAGVDSVSTTPR